MTKKDKELLKEAAMLISESSGFMQLLYERLYSRAGDAWQFRQKLDDLQARSAEFIKETAPSTPKPKPEPTVGSEEEDDGGMEISGLS